MLRMACYLLLAIGILRRLMLHVHRLRLAAHDLLHILRLRIITGLRLRRLLEKGTVLRLARHCLPRLANLSVL